MILVCEYAEDCSIMNDSEVLEESESSSSICNEPSTKKKRHNRLSGMSTVMKYCNIRYFRSLSQFYIM